jgi:hypothetical protein
MTEEIKPEEIVEAVKSETQKIEQSAVPEKIMDLDEIKIGLKSLEGLMKDILDSIRSDVKTETKVSVPDKPESGKVLETKDVEPQQVEVETKPPRRENFWFRKIGGKNA